MSKWYQHEEWAMVADAVRAYRDELDGYQPTNHRDASFDERKVAASYAGEELADRIEKALRSTDWRRVEGQAEQDRRDTYIAQEDVRLGIEPDPQDGGGGE